MKSTIRLFKALPIKSKRKKNPSKKLLEKTIPKGFIFSPEVIYNYSETDVNKLIKVVEDKIGLTGEKLNNSFHKSWKKIKDASIEQLLLEQIFHYVTTYGFEELGCYNESTVYIPNEKLEIPELKEDIKLTLIKGYTKAELKEKLLKLLGSGIALAEDTIKDVIEVANFIELNEKEIEAVKNREVKIALYDKLKLIPENPIEFLRYVIYKSTGKTLLIKDKATIEAIKENSKVASLFIKYKQKYTLEKLSIIFYRFKPIFLAFRTNDILRPIINKIRKLAKKHHKPMPEDYLNSITSKIKHKEDINETDLDFALAETNTFRKIRLAYALKFRTNEVESILYKIRNGKGYATEFNFENKTAAKRVLKIVLDSITKDISKNVKGKKIYIPDYVTYTLPATEKQFTGYFPSGSYITTDKDMIVGVHWDNVAHHRIDLDLSMIDHDSKIGWDSSYRNEARSILFSGDMTDAQAPNGASELFYVKRQGLGASIMVVNYYNHEEDVEVPFKIVVAKEQASNFGMNYMVNPNKVLSIAKSKIDQKQKVLGLLVTTTNECRFYFTETYLGRSITSSNSEFMENTRQYLFDYHRNMITLNDLLGKAGAKMVKKKDKCDIDLTPEELEKDTILNLIL